jgi:hypothetical protein
MVILSIIRNYFASVSSLIELLLTKVPSCVVVTSILSFSISLSCLVVLSTSSHNHHIGSTATHKSTWLLLSLTSCCSATVLVNNTWAS